MKKIMVVNSTAGTAERQKKMLSRDDFTVLTAVTAEQALEAHSSRPVDLIVVGLDLKDMPADEFCARIRQDDNLCHVSIVIVGHNADKDATLVTRCKANAFIALPLQPAAFLEKIGQILQIPVRKSYRVLFKVTVTGSRGEDSFFCNSQNISASGVLLETAKTLGNGANITCSFFLPGAGKITTSGEIARVIKKDDTYHYGVKFVDIKPAFRSAIDKFVKERAARPSL
jgi:DNA-binding NtrC family response regulator